MPQDKPVVRMRTKTVRVTCTEEQALEVVLPFVHLTAYLMAIDTVQAMPDTASIKRNIDSVKMKIATLLANKLGRVVEPNDLSFITVQVIPGGGYFKLEMTETQLGATRVVHGHKLVLQGPTGTTLMDKLYSTLDKEDMSPEEITKATVKRMFNTGL